MSTKILEGIFYQTDLPYKAEYLCKYSANWSSSNYQYWFFNLLTAHPPPPNPNPEHCQAPVEVPVQGRPSSSLSQTGPLIEGRPSSGHLPPGALLASLDKSILQIR